MKMAIVMVAVAVAKALLPMRTRMRVTLFLNDAMELVLVSVVEHDILVRWVVGSKDAVHSMRIVGLVVLKSF